MIEAYFFRTSTITRLRSGPLGSDLDDLATTLQQQGYTWDSIRHYLRGCDQFARWLSSKAMLLLMSIPRLSSATSVDCHGRLRADCPKQQGLSHLLKLWRQQNRLPEANDQSPCTEADQWLLRYEQYLDQVCGVAASTRYHYLRMAGVC